MTSHGNFNDIIVRCQIDWKSYIVRKRLFMAFLINFVHQSHSTIFHRISLHLIFFRVSPKIEFEKKNEIPKSLRSLPSLNNLLVYSANSHYKFSVWLFSRSTLTCVESANRQNEIEQRWQGRNKKGFKDSRKLFSPQIFHLISLLTSLVSFVAGRRNTWEGKWKFFILSLFCWLSCEHVIFEMWIRVVERRWTFRNCVTNGRSPPSCDPFCRRS